jgi:hypothetical protein
MLDLMEGNSSFRTAHEDIPGIVGVVSDDGGFTNAVYFTSYEASRRLDEDNDMPSDVQARGEEMMTLVVGEPEYLDLKDPWLGCPR